MPKGASSALQMNFLLKVKIGVGSQGGPINEALYSISIHSVYLTLSAFFCIE